MRRAGYEVAGVDLFPDQRAELWRRWGCKVRLCNLDEQPLPFADEQFEAVVFSEVIEHSELGRHCPRCERWRACCSHSGRLVITTPNQFYIKSRLRTLADILLGRPFEPFDEFTARDELLVGSQRYYNHSRLYTMRELRWLVEQSGLRVALARYGDAWEQVGVEAGPAAAAPAARGGQN